MAWTTPRTWTLELVDATDFNTHIRDNLISVLPIATLILRCAAYTTTETAVESRWLQCNGVAVSRSTYSLLFAYLNSLSPALPFGSGNGTTTFNLPDLRGRAAWAEGEATGWTDNMGVGDGLPIAERSPEHHHLSQYGTTSVGGSVPVAATFDSTITNTYPTTLSSAGNGAGLQDAPSYLVVGSWFIKYN
jgi:microcystin-dependent protein